MSERENTLGKDDALEILQRYLGSSSWLAGNFTFLDRYRANPLNRKKWRETEEISKEELRRYLGVKRLEARYDLDNHLGQLSIYAWLRPGHPTGGGFSPIFNAIELAQEKFSLERERLDSISRRIAYLCFLKREMEYMNKRYDYEEIPLIFEFYSTKVEVYTTMLVDLLLILGQLWFDQPDVELKPDKSPQRFEEILDCYSHLEKGGYSFFNSLNIMLELSAAVSARHNYVHDIGPRIELTNQGGIIEYPIPKEHRFGEFQRYIEDMPRFFRLQLPAGKTTDFQDPRFPNFQYKLKRGRRGTFDYDGSTVDYKSSVPQFLEMLEHLLAIICQAVFTTILK